VETGLEPPGFSHGEIQIVRLDAGPGSLEATEALVISSDDPLARQIVANLWRRYRFAKKMLARSESQSYSGWARLSLESNRRQAWEAAVAASNALYAYGPYAGLHDEIMVRSSARARVRRSAGQEHLGRGLSRHGDNPLARSIVAILWKIHRAQGLPLGESSESWNAAVTASQILYGTSDFEYVHRALAHDVSRVRVRPAGLPQSTLREFRVEHDQSWRDRARASSPAG
jgi:hypothetical protein